MHSLLQEVAVVHEYYGYAGKILRIDLATGNHKESAVPESLITSYIGGSGFCSIMLYNELKAGIDPLGKENKLFFATGPFTGTLWPQSSRYSVAAKSPLTGGWGEAHAGGFWGPELKFAGYDGIIIEDISSKPVYVYIEDSKVSIYDADDLWGLTTHETEDRLKHEWGKEVKVASIGPAGENKVFVSCIINDMHRAAARSGLGAVMGSKKVKAIVVRGTQGIKIPHTDEYLRVMRRFREKIAGDPFTEMKRKYGTTYLVEFMNEIGRLPSYNFQTSVFKYADMIGGEEIYRKYFLKPRACFGCMQSCGRLTTVKEGPFAYIGVSPEYESLSALGSRCGNTDVKALLYAHHLCNQLGLDTIGTGGVISWAMECFEKNLLDKRFCDLNLEWGDVDTTISLIKMIAAREGFGNILADGSYRAAETVGNNTMEYVMHVKKAEIAAQDGRAHKSMGLTSAVSPRGADHLYAFPVLDEGGFDEEIRKIYGEEYWPEMGERRNPKYKGYLVFVDENFAVVVDSLGTCKYGTMIPPALHYEEVREGLKVTTGIEFTIEELKRIGERIVNLNRAFNIREGFTRKDDMLPQRFLTEPSPEGPSKGEIVELDYMLKEYYHHRGWNAEGVPTPEKLKQLDLEFVIDDLPSG
jgi:aldehyde:ferredoxin oxidoreductase